MPTFEIQSADGKGFQVEAPDMDTAIGAVTGRGPAAPAAPSAPGADTSISANNLVRSAATGIPILGGLANKADAAINATLAPVMNPLFSPENQLQGNTWGERYANSLGEQNAMDQAFGQAHPIVDTAAQVAGAVGATAPLAATGLGAKVLGLTARTLPGQIAAGAASGAGINAADALTRGNDPLQAAGVGFALGGAAPAVARGVGAVAQPVINTARGIMNPAAEAARRVATATDRDIAAAAPGTMAGLSPTEFSGAQAAGTPVMNMDIGDETTRALARSAANTSPEGRAILNKAIDDRYETQGQRLTDWLQNKFNFPNVEAQQAALAAQAKAVNNPAYKAAQNAADERFPNGMWPGVGSNTLTPEQTQAAQTLQRLTSSPDVLRAMKGALDEGAGRAVAEGYGSFNPGVTFDNGMLKFGRAPSGAMQYPTMQMWDYTYRNLRDQADTAFRKGQTGFGGSLKAQANMLRDALDTMVPEFGQARAGAASFFGANDALEAGREFAGQSGRSFDNRGARAALAKMTPQQQQLFQDGFVDQYVQNIRSRPDRANILNQIGASPAAREQLNIALGPQNSQELEAMLRVENVMDRARGAIQGNSTTARQLAELGLAGAGGSVLSGGGNPFSDPTTALNSMLVYGAMKGGRAGLGAIDHRVSLQVAKLLTSNNPAQIRMGMKMLARNKGLMGALRNADTLLARTGATQTQRPAQ